MKVLKETMKELRGTDEEGKGVTIMKVSIEGGN